MRKPLLYLAYTLPPLLLITGVCYYFFDQPTALLMQSWYLLRDTTANQHDWAMWLTQVAYCFMVPLYLMYFILRAQNKDSVGIRCLGLLNLSVAVTFFMKGVLQFGFGRYAPRYSKSDLLLFVHNPDWYGFAWFKNGGSFPSGHMAMLSTGLTAIILYYPKSRIPALVLLLALAGILLLLNYHFISDIIAGVYLGTSITLALHYLSRPKAGNSTGC